MFVAGKWTLEYDIALDSAIAKPFYLSALWAEKLSNAKTGEPQEGKAAEVKAKVKADFEKWEEDWAEDPRKSEKMAFAIYKCTMLDKDISKAITAQVFAGKLAKCPQRDKLAKTILASKHFEYIVDAICHVTKPRDAEEADASDL